MYSITIFLKNKMAKNWYPVIDYTLCKECGLCINKCTHGVYDKENYPKPNVVEPVECIDHCHGCGDLCPVGAITYFGEDTSWTPKNKTAQTCSCSCKKVV